MLIQANGLGQGVSGHLSKHGDKDRTVNKGVAVMRKGKLLGEIFGIALVPVLVGDVWWPPGDGAQVVYYGLPAPILGAGRPLEDPNDMGNGGL